MDSQGILLSSLAGKWTLPPIVVHHAHPSTYDPTLCSLVVHHATYCRYCRSRPVHTRPGGGVPGGTPRDPRGAKFCTFRRVFNKSPIRDKHGTPIFSVFLHFWDKIAIGTNMVWVGTNIMALYIAIWGVYTVPPTPPIFCIYLCTYLAQKRSFWGYPGGSIGTPRETPE